MKLLIITQAVDEKDPVLGFFCRWIVALAERTESVTVICLYEGSHALPGNVRVHSLGKEKIVSGKQKAVSRKIQYATRFLTLAWTLRREYDRVFVHMNQEYVLLGAPLWKMWGKRVFLWRNHAAGSLLTRIAGALSTKVFYTSPSSFTARMSNAVSMPVGIDTAFFRPDPSVARIPRSLLFLGRIAPVKNVRACIELLRSLKESGVAFKATIAGNALPQDAAYEQEMHAAVSRYGLLTQVQFVGAVDAEGARYLYRTHELYVNLTPPGSMDKTIFEAMACGAGVLVHNTDLASAVGEDRVLRSLSSSEGVEKLEGLLANPSRGMREFVEREHSLSLLVERLREEMTL